MGSATPLFHGFFLPKKMELATKEIQISEHKLSYCVTIPVMTRQGVNYTGLKTCLSDIILTF